MLRIERFIRRATLENGLLSQNLLPATMCYSGQEPVEYRNHLALVANVHSGTQQQDTWTWVWESLIFFYWKGIGDT